MAHDGLRHIDERGTGIRDAAAEIVVLVEQEDVFVEAAEFQENIAADEKAGSGEERRAGLAFRQHELAARIVEIGGESSERGWKNMRPLGSTICGAKSAASG